MVYINDTEEAAGFTVAVDLTGTNAVADEDELELLLGGSSFTTPLKRTLTSTDISDGYTFTVEADQLGTDESKTLTAKVTDKAGNPGTEGAGYTFELDTEAPTFQTLTAPDASYLILALSEGVYNKAGGSELPSDGIEAADFIIDITLIESESISSVKTEANGNLSGGASTVRLNMGVNYVENSVITLTPIVNSIYDKAGNVMITTQSNNSVTYSTGGGRITSAGTNSYIRSAGDININSILSNTVAVNQINSSNAKGLSLGGNAELEEMERSTGINVISPLSTTRQNLNTIRINSAEIPVNLISRNREVKQERETGREPGNTTFQNETDQNSENRDQSDSQKPEENITAEAEASEPISVGVDPAIIKALVEGGSVSPQEDNRKPVSLETIIALMAAVGAMALLFMEIMKLIKRKQ